MLIEATKVMIYPMSAHSWHTLRTLSRLRTSTRLRFWSAPEPDATEARHSADGSKSESKAQSF